MSNTEMTLKERLSWSLLRWLFYVPLWIILKIITTIVMPGSFWIKGLLSNRPKTCHLVIARHRSYWDTVLVPLTLATTKVLYIAREGLVPLWPFEHIPILRRIFENRLIIFLNREKPTISQWKAIQRTANNKRCKAIVIFPEGTTNPKTRKVYAGFVRLAQKYSLPILPVNIVPGRRYGKDNHAKWWRYLTWQAALTRVRIGKSFNLNEFKDSDQQKIAEEAMKIVDQV